MLPNLNMHKEIKGSCSSKKRKKQNVNLNAYYIFSRYWYPSYLTFWAPMRRNKVSEPVSTRLLTLQKDDKNNPKSHLFSLLNVDTNTSALLEKRCVQTHYSVCQPSYIQGCWSREGAQPRSGNQVKFILLRFPNKRTHLLIFKSTSLANRYAMLVVSTSKPALQSNLTRCIHFVHVSWKNVGKCSLFMSFRVTLFLRVMPVWGSTGWNHLML